MTNSYLYADIAARTHGDIYIGVVGPVRTGKSTFIGRFMDTLVIPAITDEHARARTTDELPQSAAGKTVMTTEPKFIPAEAVGITLEDSAVMRVKMIDCVGYVVPGAMGLTEDDAPRMVMTPWADEPMPFGQAAEIGTHKVISEHATVAVLVTTDGSIGELPRVNYIAAEQRVASELKACGKPFVIVLNSAHPENAETVALAEEMENQYASPVALVNCLSLNEEDIRGILSLLLREFPVTELRFAVPKWFAALEDDHPLKSGVVSSLKKRAAGIMRVSEVKDAFTALDDTAYDSTLTLDGIDLASGSAAFTLGVPDGTYYSILAEKTGFDVTGKESLLPLLSSLADMKKRFDRLSDAFTEAEQTGYGIVKPKAEDMTLREPEIVRQVGGYGVRLRASAPSFHLIRADIETEVCPVVGSEKQSEDVVKYLLKDFEEDPSGIWASNLFGTPLYELMNEGISAKLNHMPTEARAKLTDTLGRIINDGASGLICVLL